MTDERNKEKDDGRTDWTPEELATRLFALVVNMSESASGGAAQVRVKKGKVAAMFNIEIERTPYFFKDRERRVNVNGNRKKIFHVVRAHHRRGAPVRISTRGEREFMWRGYEVTITVPGLHHNRLQEWTGGAYEHDDEELRAQEAIFAADAGQLIANAMEGKPNGKGRADG
jgi:hypothetical protein